MKIARKALAVNLAGAYLAKANFVSALVDLDLHADRIKLIPSGSAIGAEGPGRRTPA